MTNTEEKEYGLGYARDVPKSSVSVVVGAPSTYGNAKPISTVDLENINPDLRERIALAQADWLANKELNPKGEPLPITSGRRTREQQYKEYKARLAGATNTGFMAINPDEPQYKDKQFFHEDAVDMLPVVPDKFLATYGLHRPYGSKDPVHVQINPNFEWKSPNAKEEESKYGLGYARPVATAEGQELFPKTNPSSFAEDFRKTVGEMSWEDWKKKSLIAPAAQYIVGSMPIVGDEAMKKEAEDILVEKGKGFIEGVKAVAENPKEVAKNVYKQVTEHPGTVLGEIVKGAVYDPELALLPGAKQTVQMATKGAKAVGEGIKTGAQAVRGAVMPSEQQLIAQFNARRTAPGASVGAMATPDQATVQTMLASASPELRATIEAMPIETVNIKALENQLKGDKFGYQLTKGEALQDAAMMSDEFNKRAKSEDLMARLQDRDAKITQGFSTLAEKAAPDLPGGMNLVDYGQTAIDQLLAKDKARLADIKTKYEALEKANGGNFPIDTNKLKSDVDAELSKKVLKSYASDNMRSYLKDLEDFQKRGNMTFDEFENLRTNMAEEMRSNPNGNARRVAGIIRQELEKLPMSEDLKGIKPLADQARQAVRERYQVLDTNPAYRVAVKDTRLDSELKEGLEHVAADKFVKKFVVDGATADVKRLMGELGLNTPGHQAAQAGLIKHLENIAVGSKGVINQKSFNDALNKTIGKKLFDVMPNDTAVDLQDLADLARLTEHVGGKGFANTSNTVPAMMREGALNAAEMGINVKTGSPIGSIGRAAMEKLTANRKIKESLETGAGVKRPIKDMLKDLENEGK